MDSQDALNEDLIKNLRDYGGRHAAWMDRRAVEALENGADPSICFKGTPLFHFVVDRNDIPMLELMLAKMQERGIDPNSLTDTDGNTALHRARTGAVVALLVNTGMEVEAENNAGDMPEDTIAEQESHIAAELLGNENDPAYEVIRLLTKLKSLQRQDVFFESKSWADYWKLRANSPGFLPSEEQVDRVSELVLPIFMRMLEEKGQRLNADAARDFSSSWSPFAGAYCLATQFTKSQEALGEWFGHCDRTGELPSSEEVDSLWVGWQLTAKSNVCWLFDNSFWDAQPLEKLLAYAKSYMEDNQGVTGELLQEALPRFLGEKVARHLATEQASESWTKPQLREFLKGVPDFVRNEVPSLHQVAANIDRRVTKHVGVSGGKKT